tara:strand:- start:449 stop:745 length:297 start_codon:yes stop_codon:yes gene_type:complete
MALRNDGVYIYANLLDINQDGKIDTISFLSPDGKGVALALTQKNSSKLKIHMLQDVTGDGKLDGKDILLIQREANKIFKNKKLSKGQLKIFLNDAEYG